MKALYLPILLFARTITSCDVNQILNTQETACVEAHIVRLCFREKIDNLRDQNILAHETYAAVSEAIRTRPISQLDQLFGYISQLHQQHSMQ